MKKISFNSKELLEITGILTKIFAIHRNTKSFKALTRCNTQSKNDFLSMTEALRNKLQKLSNEDIGDSLNQREFISKLKEIADSSQENEALQLEQEISYEKIQYKCNY